MTLTLIEEVKETAIDYLKDNECMNTYGCDLHNEIFNTDYFCCYTSDCKKYLEQYGVFKAIEKVQEYEKFNFGEVTTDLSDPFKLLHMLVYILGEEFLNNSNTFSFIPIYIIKSFFSSLSRHINAVFVLFLIPVINTSSNINSYSKL